MPLDLLFPIPYPTPPMSLVRAQKYEWGGGAGSDLSLPPSTDQQRIGCDPDVHPGTWGLPLYFPSKCCPLVNALPFRAFRGGSRAAPGHALRGEALVDRRDIHGGLRFRIAAAPEVSNLRRRGGAFRSPSHLGLPRTPVSGSGIWWGGGRVRSLNHSPHLDDGPLIRL